MYPELDENSVFSLKTALYEVEVEDVYNWKELYKEVYRWLQEEGFKHLDGTDYVEDLYWERHNAGGGIDYHVWWRVKRDNASNDFFRQFLKINFQGINMGKAETMVDGHKVNTNKGDGIIRVEAHLILDPDKRLRNHPIAKHFIWMFIKRIYKDRIKEQKNDLYKTAYRLQVRIKQYLGLKHSLEPPKLFHHVKGV
jgi:hypothetical protein